MNLFPCLSSKCNSLLPLQQPSTSIAVASLFFILIGPVIHVANSAAISNTIGTSVSGSVFTTTRTIVDSKSESSSLRPTDIISTTTERSGSDVTCGYLFCNPNFEYCEFTYYYKCVENKTITGCSYYEYWEDDFKGCKKHCIDDMDAWNGDYCEYSHDGGSCGFSCSDSGWVYVFFMFIYIGLPIIGFLILSVAIAFSCVRCRGCPFYRRFPNELIRIPPNPAATVTAVTATESDPQR